jgi:hypothetical protein
MKGIILILLGTATNIYGDKAVETGKSDGGILLLIILIVYNFFLHIRYL